MTSRGNPYNRTDPRASNNASTGQNAALRGAALAFAKPLVKPKPNAYNGNNGALAAATKAGNNPHSASRSISVIHTGTNGKDEYLLPQYSGASSAYESTGGGIELGLVRQKLNRIVIADTADHLQLPGLVLDRSISPSHIAAALAASRSAPTSPSHTGQQPGSSSVMQMQASSSRRSSVRSVSQSRDVPDEALDTSSIPPTTSLIGMFERSAGNTPSANKAKSNIIVTKSEAPEVKSPKPIRAQPAFINPNPTKLPKLALPTVRKRDGESMSGPQSVQQSPSGKKADEGEGSSDDSFISASDRRPPSSPACKHRPTSKSENERAIDSLANAIVASSLATSRTTSPSKASQNLAPPLLPPRRSNTTLFHNHNTLDSRTPSPAKGLRQTMRKPPKDEEEEDLNMQRRGRKNIMKKHPNKHHEGDRKRWRDSITARERKRYEAVWASNRGLYVTSNTSSFPPPPVSGAATDIPDPNSLANSVSNIVVRDVWSRSRLGNDVLAEVWELVDRTGSGRLSREEFVTGLWLIDQRLKGRKLPIRVGDSVWASIGSLGGVRVKGNGRKR